MNTITERQYTELKKMMAETDNLMAETRKMNAETIKIQIEAQTFKLRHAVAAVIVTVVFVAAIVGLIKAFL